MSRKLSIRREPHGDGFVYRRGGRLITAVTEIERIEAIAVPPGWRDVSIAASAGAKTQAIGTDGAGRRQRIYSAAHRRRQERAKHDRVLLLAEALPNLRRRVDRDLRRTSLRRDRVVAGVVWLIDREGFRTGSSEYVGVHGSFGVTTLRRRHVRVRSSSVEFDFKGKLGRRHRRLVRDARIARLLARLEELPGTAMFESLDADGEVHGVRALHANEYIRRYTGVDCSAKDLRTWSATRAAVELLLEVDAAELRDERSRATAVRDIIGKVAERLGNTPDVARESYIDPRALAVAEHPERLKRLQQRRSGMRPRRFRSVDEQLALDVLHDH
nr:DNA topoisomerase IB [uncultured Agrococcus sp.]